MSYKKKKNELNDFDEDSLETFYVHRGPRKFGI